MRSYVGPTAVAVAATALMGVIGWVVAPGGATAWMFVIAFPPLLWGALEALSSGESEAALAIRRLHRIMIIAICCVFLLDGGPKLAISRGLLDPSLEPGLHRIRGFFFGLLWLAWGNHLPKVMSPWGLDSEPFDWQNVHRFVGRVAALGGAVLMLVWATLPIAAAHRTMLVVVPVITVLGVGRKWLSVLRYSGGRGEAVR